MSFSNLKLSELIQKTLAAEGYRTPTPIQKQAIPHVLEGRDVLGCAQTGTGKTAAFALPILQRLAATATGHGAPRHVRCLVLCPTRELATQIGESFRTYGKGLDIRHTVVFGGVNQKPQAATLRQGVDVVVATPGRLLDLMNQRLVDLRHVQVLVLDEADRMLDMGFIHDIRKVIAVLPTARQNLLFSATMPTEIRRLADSILKNPVSVQVAPVAATADRIEQSLYYVAKADKPALLAKLFNELPMSRALVFTRTKHGADRVVRHLHKYGIRAEAIHGNKSQNARERALANFKSQKTPILVATDIASRGIDIDEISHVVNFDLTHEPETYVHRIGRTARAGAAGCAISFCDHDERDNLRAIERLIRIPIPVKSGPLSQRGQGASGDGQPHPRPQQHRTHARPEHQQHAKLEHRPHIEQRQPHEQRYQPRAEYDTQNRSSQHHPRLEALYQQGQEERQRSKSSHRHQQTAAQRDGAQHPRHGATSRHPDHRSNGATPKHGAWHPSAHRGRPAFAGR